MSPVCRCACPLIRCSLGAFAYGHLKPAQHTPADAHTSGSRAHRPGAAGRARGQAGVTFGGKMDHRLEHRMDRRPAEVGRRAVRQRTDPSCGSALRQRTDPSCGSTARADRSGRPTDPALRPAGRRGTVTSEDSTVCATRVRHDVHPSFPCRIDIRRSRHGGSSAARAHVAAAPATVGSSRSRDVGKALSLAPDDRPPHLDWQEFRQD
jgi:hypothetical protein